MREWVWNLALTTYQVSWTDESGDHRTKFSGRERIDAENLVRSLKENGNERVSFKRTRVEFADFS